LELAIMRRLKIVKNDLMLDASAFGMTEAEIAQ